MSALYLTFVAMVAVLATIAVVFAPRWGKWVGASLFVTLLIAGPLVYYATLSKPKLLWDEWRNDEEVKVLGFYVAEGKALYYFLLLPGVDEPRYYYEPWSEGAKRRAEQLQKHARQKQGSVLRLPFERSLDERPPLTVHPLPQPRLLPKPAAPPVQEYQA